MRLGVSLEFGVKYMLPVVFGLAGVALVLFISSTYGIGLAPDSANYVSAAQSLLFQLVELCAMLPIGVVHSAQDRAVLVFRDDQGHLSHSQALREQV